MNPPPVCLIILDGFGEAAPGADNAVTLADPKFLYGLRDRWPLGFLDASGIEVGLPCGLMGNSEVGHLNIGAGRVVYQEISRIDKAIAQGEFQRNEVLVNAIDHVVRDDQAKLHLFGLTSDGGVHSSLEHLSAVLQLAKARGLAGDRVVLHAFLDGRDTPPRSAAGYLQGIETTMAEHGVGRVGSIIGRYFAMDRDQRWDRTEKAFRALVHGDGHHASTAQEGLAAAYSRDETDEFVGATVIGEGDRVRNGDGVFFFNFRTDRGRQLTEAFVMPKFDGFSRGPLQDLHFATMTRYRADFPVPAAYQPQRLDGIMPDLVSEAGLRQMRIAETEKYAHVTFFLSGGNEKELPGERRILIPSPKVATYDEQPAMSAVEVTDAYLKALDDEENRPHMTWLNFANADMVGHTGIIPAAVSAVRTLDQCLARIVPKIIALGGVVAITADHGNAEQMRDPITGEPHTAHTTNAVPLLFCGDPVSGRTVASGGRLCDLAPSLLPLLGLPKGAGMDGVDLLG